MHAPADFVAQGSRMRILELLMRRGPISRKQLARLLGVTSSSVTKTTAAMMEEGLLYEGEETESRGAGRREVLLHIGGGAGHVLGVDVSARDAEVTLLALSGRVAQSRSFAFPQLNEAVLNEVLAAARTMPQQAGPGGVRGAGLLAQGYIENDECRSLPLPDILRRAEAALGLPFTLCNNVRGLARAEQFLGSPPDDFVLLKYGPGIGSVIVSGGKVLDGARHSAGEIGHIAWPGGQGAGPCHVCGKPACLETACGFEAVITAAGGARGGGNLAAVLAASERDGGGALRAAMHNVAQAAALMVQVLDTRQVLLAGEIFTLAPYFAAFERQLRACAGGLPGVDILPVSGYEEKRRKAAGIVALDAFLRTGG